MIKVNQNAEQPAAPESKKCIPESAKTSNRFIIAMVHPSFPSDIFIKAALTICSNRIPCTWLK